ncbi:hypothetical protein RFI_29613 [Reticulomyxa filosa]|uniref:Uncharacterized protein n=1 Tax=Reticulomyxa filosa TaxID=46433 RepID=X6M2U6_RETFI|nr:hypothetical protein RFI_29613 [Reticulomyxa filosa]|eukprot:ETO07777.1 hypothetical protein RFI_29613 [Reticulomyxa filosa]
MYIKMVFTPFIVFFDILEFICKTCVTNTVFAVFLWVNFGAICLYQAHVYKYTDMLEPAATLLWVGFFANVFVIWYTSSERAFLYLGNEISLLGFISVKKLVLMADTRIAAEKVKRMHYAFICSLFAKFARRVEKLIVCCLYTIVKEYINCQDNEQDSSSPAPLTSDVQNKYSSEYDAMCSSPSFGLMVVSVIFCTLDWFLLLALALYWHVNDRYQRDVCYDDTKTVWHEHTLFTISSVSSTVTWIGRILHGEFSKYEFFLKAEDADRLHQYLTENGLWFSKLKSDEPGARELMPKAYMNIHFQKKLYHDFFLNECFNDVNILITWNVKLKFLSIFK